MDWAFPMSSFLEPTEENHFAAKAAECYLTLWQNVKRMYLFS